MLCGIIAHQQPFWIAFVLFKLVVWLNSGVAINILLSQIES